MDIGHDIMGTIIINSYAFGGGSSVSAVSDLYSKDNAGNGANGGAGGFGDSRITLTTGTGHPQHDLETQPVFFPRDRPEKDDEEKTFFERLQESLIKTIKTSSPVFTVANNLGANAEYEVSCVVTNAGGATTQAFPLSLIFA